METDVGLKSRMRENCTYGSVRGSRQAFHLQIYERSVETVYSTKKTMSEEKLNELKKKVADLQEEIRKLTPEELEKVFGGTVDDNKYSSVSNYTFIG